MIFKASYDFFPFVRIDSEAQKDHAVIKTRFVTRFTLVQSHMFLKNAESILIRKLCTKCFPLYFTHTAVPESIALL